MAYSRDELEQALNDCWMVLRDKCGEPEDGHGPISPEIITLCAKHQCLAELGLD